MLSANQQRQLALKEVLNIKNRYKNETNGTRITQQYNLNVESNQNDKVWSPKWENGGVQLLKYEIIDVFCDRLRFFF